MEWDFTVVTTTVLPARTRCTARATGRNTTSPPAGAGYHIWNAVQWDDAAAYRKTTIKLSHATSAGLSLFGQRILDYDMNSNLVNGVFYSPEDMTSMEITADIYVDRTTVEVFIDNGAYSYSLQRKRDPGAKETLNFWGNRIEVKNLEIYNAESAWK